MNGRVSPSAASSDPWENIPRVRDIAVDWIVEQHSDWNPYLFIAEELWYDI